jgi:hypothetical protein
MNHANAPLRRPARRRARCLAALVALVVVTSNALAAMGMCMAKAPVAPSSVIVADGEAPCLHHEARAENRSGQADPAAQAHCPQDDPGAQVRATDIPGVGLPMLSFQPRESLLVPRGTLASAATVDASPPQPLYARLARLLL